MNYYRFRENRLRKGRRRGFSMTELLIAILFLSLVLAGLLSLSSMSNRQTMDAYYEFLALQLALEPIEVFRALGYHRLKEYSAQPFDMYPLGLNEVRDAHGGGIVHPVEASSFMRDISLEMLDNRDNPLVNGIKVTVRVIPKVRSRIAAWLIQGVTVEALVMERPQ